MLNHWGHHSNATAAQPGDNNDINLQDSLKGPMMDFPVNANPVLPEGNHRVEPFDIDGDHPQDLEVKDMHSEALPHFIYMNPQDTDLDDIFSLLVQGFQKLRDTGLPEVPFSNHLTPPPFYPHLTRY